MKKTKIREWTCDRCGKTATTTSAFFRPLSIDKTKLNIGAGLYKYQRKWDLCTDCAYSLADMLDKYMSKKDTNLEDTIKELIR